jgi:IS1 family transposase
MQSCLDQALGAKRYYSDAFPIYGKLYYGAPFELLKNKSETYSVEAVNADMRHYMKRLARRSRCFSRKLYALRKNMKLFVYCYNQRQIMNRKFPKYQHHLIDFLYPVV